jgi:TPR repeat protein
MNDQAQALAEGFYRHAEKLMWGDEDTAKNLDEALRLYRQAADLGFADAYIRIGELHEYRTGTAQNVTEALLSYQRAIKAGNFYGYAFIAMLLSRTSHIEAEGFWDKFFDALEAEPEPGFLADTPGGLIHAYLATQLLLGLDPKYVSIIRQHRHEVIAHHQQLLEHSASSEQLDRLEAVASWMKTNLS